MSLSSSPGIKRNFQYGRPTWDYKTGGPMRKVSLLLILLVVPTAVFAQDWRDGGPRDRYNRRYRTDNRFEITPFGGYRWGGTLFADTTGLFDRDVDAKSSGDYGLNLGIPIGYSNMKVELMVNH